MNTQRCLPWNFLCPLHRDVDNISLMYPEIPVVNFMALFLLFSFLREVLKDCFNCWWPVKWCWNLGFLEMICDCRHCFFTICCVRRDNFINVLYLQVATLNRGGHFGGGGLNSAIPLKNLASLSCTEEIALYSSVAWQVWCPTSLQWP